MKPARKPKTPPADLERLLNRLERNALDYRRRLRADPSVDPSCIDKLVASYKFEHVLKWTDDRDHANRVAYGEWAQPDDAGYRPTRHDPLLTGPARATGITARAVTRGTTYTDWQLDEATRRNAS